VFSSELLNTVSLILEIHAIQPMMVSTSMLSGLTGAYKAIFLKQERSEAVHGSCNAILRDVILPEIKITKTELAEIPGISRQMLYGILNEEKSISPETATRLGAFFGNSSILWMNMQVKYDLYLAAKSAGKRKLDAIEKRRSTIAV
jgi:addiction module HigA family antidote